MWCWEGLAFKGRWECEWGFQKCSVQSPLKITKQFSERERALIPACPWRSVPLKVRPKVFLSAQLLCEGDAALTLPEMTKPKGLSCAADPYGGLFINFIQCLCEHGVCIIILHHYFWFRELAELVSSEQVPVSFWGEWRHCCWILCCVFCSRITVQMK